MKFLKKSWTALKRLWNNFWWEEVKFDTTVEEALEAALEPQPEIVMSEYDISNHPDEQWVFKWRELLRLNDDLTEAYEIVCETLMAGKKLDWYWLQRMDTMTQKAVSNISLYTDDKWYRRLDRYIDHYDAVHGEHTIKPDYTYNNDVAENCRFPQFIQPVHLLLADTTHCAGLLTKMVKGLITNNPGSIKLHTVRYRSSLRRKRPLKPDVDMSKIIINEVPDEGLQSKN